MMQEGSSCLCTVLGISEYILVFHPVLMVGKYLLTRRSKVGYGQHGDYLFGWKGDVLQKVMDALPSGKCVNANCSVLKIQAAKDVMACKKAQQIKEDVGTSGASWLKVLPGGVTVMDV
jgi:hypothetical protein